MSSCSVGDVESADFSFVAAPCLLNPSTESRWFADVPQISGNVEGSGHPWVKSAVEEWDSDSSVCNFATARFPAERVETLTWSSLNRVLKRNV